MFIIFDHPVLATDVWVTLLCSGHLQYMYAEYNYIRNLYWKNLPLILIHPIVINFYKIIKEVKNKMKPSHPITIFKNLNLRSILSICVVFVSSIAVFQL